jgi:hypothetical protein
MGDIITRRAAGQIDVFEIYTNSFTACSLGGAKLPLVAENDREAVSIVVGTLWGVKPETILIGPLPVGAPDSQGAVTCTEVSRLPPHPALPG